MTMYLYTRSLFFTTLLITIVSEVNTAKRGKKKNHHGNSLWKQEYEDELNDAMLSKKGNNFTRFVQSTQAENEAVIDRLMDSITASEKYMKKIESMDFRLNRLDVEIHEKTNDIIKRLVELTKVVNSQDQFDKIENRLTTIKTELDTVKSIVDKKSRGIQNKAVNAEATECNMDAALDHRLTVFETLTKSVLKNVESIAGVISEVKSRQYSRNNNNKVDIIGAGLDSSGLINEFRRVMYEQRSRRCDCSRMSGRVERSERYPTDCREIQMQGFNISGIYKVKPDDIEPFYVLCDLTSSGGGWTVIQNRFDGSQDFYKGWLDYKHGFGNLAGEFWLGLEKIYYLTNQKLYELRIELESLNGQEAAAAYSVFTLGPEFEGYRISTLGIYRGSAGDSLSYHAGQKFSTFDADNDDWKDGACASEHGGAWWYKECDKSNLNGKFTTNVEENNGQTIYWITFKGPNSPLSKTRMMIRPLPASRPLDFDRSRLSKDGSKIHDKQKPHPKDAAYDTGRSRSPYKYDDLHSEGFFPNYT